MAISVDSVSQADYIHEEAGEKLNVPSVDLLIQFAVFLVPGTVTLLLSSIISGSDIRKRSELELVILAAILSLISIFMAGVPMTIDGITRASQSSETLMAILLDSLVLGVMLGMISVIWLHIGNLVSGISQRLGSYLRIPYMSYEKGCAYYVLNNVLMERKKNQLIVETTSGNMLRGYLGGFSELPLEVILVAEDGKPLMEYSEGKWLPLEESVSVMSEKRIMKISVVKDHMSDSA